MSRPARCAASALVGAALLLSFSSCFIYNEDLLSDGGGGTGGAGASGGGGGTGGGCVGSCLHLLISEIVVSPTRAELVEVFNPLEESVPLDDVFIADFPDYHLRAVSSPMVGATDFLVQFPAGSTIAPGERLVVAIDTAASFTGEYGQAPDFDIGTMLGTTTPGMSGLANGDEMIVLFQWDGASALVQDLDYVIWGDTSDAIDKTGLQTYADDTPADQQSPAASPSGATALHRCDMDESGETKTGGNGALGHDETSENLAASFGNGTPTPKASPPAGVCP